MIWQPAVRQLDGTFTNQQFQVGADAGQTITVSSIASARTSALGAYYSASVVSSAVNSTPQTSGIPNSNCNPMAVPMTSARSAFM